MESGQVTAEDVAAGSEAPEGLVPDLDLSAHLDGYWPSSRNVTQ